MISSCLMPYYPKYSILDEIISDNNYKKMNIFIDLKNTLQTLYMKNVILLMTENIKKSNFLDTSILQSVLEFLSWHKIYSLKRGIEINFYIFYDFGNSFYHQNVDKKYKISRKIDDLFGLDSVTREMFFTVIQRNLKILEKLGNKIPNTYVLVLEHLESDFVPYYILRNNLIELDEKNCHIIYSNDHDLMQCLYICDHVFQFRKLGKNKSVLRKSDVPNKYLKHQTSLLPEHLPLAMGIIGEIGDDVKGITGIGKKTVEHAISDLLKIYTDQELYKKILKNEELFPQELDYYKNIFSNKITIKVVEQEKNEKRFSKSLKLTSFEILSRFFDDANTTEAFKRKENFINIFKNKESVSLPSLKKALSMNKIFINEDDLDILFYK